MARGVHHVDLHVLIADGGVLSQNRNAALTLQIAGVHDTVHNLLIFPVSAALLQHLVHQGGLAVVNVGDDGYVSQMFVLHIWNIPSCFLPSIDNSRQTALQIREERLSILVN